MTFNLSEWADKWGWTIPVVLIIIAQIDGMFIRNELRIIETCEGKAINQTEQWIVTKAMEIYKNETGKTHEYYTTGPGNGTIHNATHNYTGT